jgi:repressor LexA
MKAEVKKKMDDRLSKRRKELGLTLEDVGNIVGVGKSTVKKWESGYIENMKRDKIALLAKALQVSPAFI